MRSNVKLSCDEAETPTVMIHARCVPMPCRRSADFDAAGIPAVVPDEGEGGDSRFQGPGDVRGDVGQYRGCRPARIQGRGVEQGLAVLVRLAALMRLAALLGLSGLHGEDMFGEMRGLEGPRDSGVTQTTVGGGGEIPGIFGILSILIDILGIPGIFNIPIRTSGAAPSMSPLRSLPRFPSKPPAPQTPIRQFFRRPPIRLPSPGTLQRIQTRGGDRGITARTQSSSGLRSSRFLPNLNYLVSPAPMIISSPGPRPKTSGSNCRDAVTGGVG